ncbi:FimV family protein [Rhodoferax sp.]|uniref:type IV pilus assembly protein FimV n=2 Tax=Rhodoferax sp. TaxID=50421 RepID=UPI0027300FEF|nr:hypothetical protein [Rhodoferax sp.]MDP1528148.1 hypothetical protein [Rhodoferax sp.]MDP1943144.1 hypothetical protein [Rhodoferax sp.]MDP2443163.1 hypothetical protein [Rhodoferax sp.]MDZ4206687.1 hypothetical protein [Rhodoferax sp.]
MSPTHIKKTVTKESVLAATKWGLVLLSGAIVAAQAMTLGELQGEALIGRALDVSIPVQSSAGDALSEGCVRADVYYGEAQQGTPRITLQESRLRVQLAEPVNEPVVRVQLRTFCSASQMRNYVLLADLPPDFSANVATNTPPVATPAASETSSANRAPAAVVLPQAAPAQAAKPVRSAARKPASSVGKSKKIAQKPKPTATKRPRDPKPAVVQQAKSVLKLDPLEILSDRMDNLELNMPFVPAEDALLQSRQIAALQEEVKSMRELAVKNDSALLALRSQLEQAQSRQMFSTLLYALIAVLLAVVAGLAWLWHSQKKLTVAAQSWWQHASDEDLTAFLQPEAAPPASKPVASVAKPLVITQPEPLPAPATAPIAINPESVQDLRQQAEFFISLGQDHRAVQILNQHVAASELPNPLVCMDLLGLYQHANQVPEFNQLREICEQHFNVRLPDLTDDLQDGQDLASYPDVLATLTRLWPGEQAQLFMDRCIFRKAATQALFDLAAFRDLLSLHALAEELALPVTPR